MSYYGKVKISVEVHRGTGFEGAMLLQTKNEKWFEEHEIEAILSTIQSGGEVVKLIQETLENDERHELLARLTDATLNRNISIQTLRDAIRVLER